MAASPLLLARSPARGTRASFPNRLKTTGQRILATHSLRRRQGHALADRSVSEKVVKKPGARRLILSQRQFTLKEAKHPDSPSRRRSDCLDGSYRLITWPDPGSALTHADQICPTDGEAEAGAGPPGDFSRYFSRFGPILEEFSSGSESSEDFFPDAGHVGDGRVDHLCGARLQDLAEQQQGLLGLDAVVGVQPADQL